LLAKIRKQRPEMQMPKRVIRVCCGKIHETPVCPDGLVMCQLCFERVKRDKLHAENGVVFNICKKCEKMDKLANE